MSASQKKRRGMSSPGIADRRRSSGVSATSVIAMILCVVLPPVGLVMLWRMGMFKPAGRLLFSTVALISLVVMFSLLRSGATPMPSTIAPVPNIPALRTVSPSKVKYVDKVITEAKETPTPVPYDEEIEYAVYVTPAPTQDVGSIMVYAVFDKPVYYHADSMCGQTNRRTLTVAEAVSEGLLPCGRCNPPTF